MRDRSNEMNGKRCVDCRFFRPLFKGFTIENPAFGGTCAHDDGPEITMWPNWSCELHEISVKYE